VQLCMTLDDFLPGFGLLTLRPGDLYRMTVTGRDLAIAANLV